MDFLLNRYRNLTVLLLVVFAQLLLIAYQLKSNSDAPLLKVWAVTAVTPVERVLEFTRANTWGYVEDYFFLVRTRGENDRLRHELGELKLQNQYLRAQLSTADRARALSAFQAQSPSKMLAARVIGNGTGANSKAVFIDRGSASGVESGMAVVTPDGIIGKVVAAYPTASLVLLITDANFAAGVISQRSRVRGTLKGQGHDGAVFIDYVQNEERVEPGEWFYTSGDDRIFPKGFPVGQAAVVRNGRALKEIYVSPSGFQGGLEEVLVVLEGVHAAIPNGQVAADHRYQLTPPLPNAPQTGQDSASAPTASGAMNTDADKLKAEYRALGDAEHHKFGEGAVGSTPPDFTKLQGLQGSNGETAASLASPAHAASSVSNPHSAPEKVSGPGAKPRARPLAARVAPEAAKLSSPAAKPGAAVKRSVPLLVTDPADADPDDPSFLPPPARPKAAPKTVP